MGGGEEGGEMCLGEVREERIFFIYSNQTIYETVYNLVHGPEEEILSTLIISIAITVRIIKREPFT